MLLHGVPQFPDDLRPLAEELSDQFRTHLVHLPGYGESPALAGEHELDVVAAALAETLAGSGVDEAAFIGSSGGFYRALQIALRPGLPEPWALVGIGPIAAASDADRNGFRQIAEALRAGVDLSESAAARFLSPEFAEAHPEARRHATDTIHAASAQTIASEFEAFAECRDLLAEVGRLEAPVYLRVGELDIPTPPDTARAIAAAATDGSIDVVPGAGHLLLLEDFPATLAAIREALLAAP